MRFLLTVVLLCVVFPFSFSQPNSQYKTIQSQQVDTFKYQLSEPEISLFEDEVKYRIGLFYQSVLNILDDSLDLEYRHIARLVLNDLFSESNAYVTDYFEFETPQAYSIPRYATLLFQLKNKLPLLQKAYKVSDSISTISKVYTFSPSEEPGITKKTQAFYKVYNGELFFSERMRFAETKNDQVREVTRREELKSVNYSIRHDNNNTYELKFNKIDIIDKNDITYNYKNLRNKIYNSTNPWTNIADQEYISRITAKARDNGILIDINEDSIRNIALEIVNNTKEDVFKTNNYRELELADYLLPGIGHTHYGKAPGRFVRTFLYGAGFTACTYLAIRFNGYSNNQKRTGLLTSDPYEKQKWLDVSQANRAASNVAIGMGLITMGANILHLKILVGRNKNRSAKPLI